MKYIFTFLLLIGSLVLQAQTTISGKVTDKKGEPLAFANVALMSTYDGASANDKGTFSFITSEKGNKTLNVSLMGYNPFVKAIDLNGSSITLNIELSESINSLNAVVVTAGMFEASDEKKMVMLKPLDIVTTAGGNADIVSVMQLLPGSNRVGETEGLFVRGGSASETKTVIDGMIVQNPFFSSTPDVPQRGRFSPFMFKGTAFSTGGYSAQYGQALSSVLLLNTQDKQGENSNTNIGANMAGINASYTHKGWITGSVQYTNIAPLLALVKTNIDFEKVPQGVGTSLSINQNLKNKATLKVYGTYNFNESAINLPNYDSQKSTYLFENKNNNIFTNANYKQTSTDGKWTSQTGFSYSRNKDNLKTGDFVGDRFDERTQVRTVASRLFGANDASVLNFGAEFHHIKLENIYNQYQLGFIDNYSAVFAETEFYLGPKLAFKPGLRAEYTSVLKKYNLAPRFSMAYKTGKFSQVSMAGGVFYQNPEKEYLYLNQSLGFEKANHLIANYQIIKNERTFRTEVFYKQYQNLIKEKTEGGFDPNPYRFPSGLLSNDGSGYAQGFDVFFRDQKSLKNGDLWVTYSFLDTERNYKNYPAMSTPYFASKHNWSVVYKQFFTKYTTNIGLTFTHTSGRPIYNKNDNFQNIAYTKPFENFSLMAAKVKQTKNNFVVFYAIVDNILGRQNIFGYRYSADGNQRFAVRPPINRMFFVGATITFGRLNGRSKEADLDL